MALPKWITPAGALGIIPNSNYYKLELNAYDESGGTLTYRLVSGQLPTGLQVGPFPPNDNFPGVVVNGISGIPTSSLGGEQTIDYKFTIRVQNSVTGGLADRTFILSVTDVVPPIIIPQDVQTIYQIISIAGDNIAANVGDYITQSISGANARVIVQQVTPVPSVSISYVTTTPFTLNSGNLALNGTSINSYPVRSEDKILTTQTDLGLYADGDIVNLQLMALENTTGASLTWTVKDGEIPPGLSLSQSGLLSGYIYPIPQPGPGSNTGWDNTYWNNQGWEFTAKAISKTFNFTIEVSDGVNYDISTYSLDVYPRSLLTVDSTTITVDATLLSNGALFTVASGNKHVPIIVTEQSELIPVRQGTYFSFNIDAIDLDSETLQYVIPAASTGRWDEQQLIGPGTPYIAAQAFNGNLYTGVFPYATIGVVSGIEQVILDYTRPALENGDVVKILDATNVWRDVTVTNATTVKLTGNTAISANIGDFITQTLSGANATISNVGPTIGTLILSGGNITANAGSTITQLSTGANATILHNLINAVNIPIQYVSGEFNTSNIALNGGNISAYPSAVPSVTTDISAFYNNAEVFILNSSDPTAIAQINGANSKSYPTSITSVGVTFGAESPEGTEGYDETKYDQSILNLPGGLSIDINTGWVTGHLPNQTVNELQVPFEVVVYKKDEPTYRTSKLFTLTILGDLNNTIEWVTPSDLGTIQNGKISDLLVSAISTKGIPLQYNLKSGSPNRLPQGLTISLSGLITGRVSFEMFSLDLGDITIDNGTTTFDNTYTFTVTASDSDHIISADRTFTIRVLNKNIKPYENLYLKAETSPTQRAYFQSIMQNRNVFPSDLIYRNDDPNFGLSQEIRTLFLPGLEPSTLAEYAAAVETNHFDKRLTFGDVKSAVVIDSSFNVKYEVVYVEILDTNTNALGQGPANTIDLTNEIATPYYDQDGNTYTIAYPNSFSNMNTEIATTIGYANKGALPDWMTSKQPNGRILGFTRAAVLAYTVPNAGELIAYRFAQQNFNLNQIDFTVDRYLLDNNYSTNFDITTGRFVKSSETTFDRYPGLTSVFRPFGTVDYAVTTSYESINQRTVDSLIASGGLDGIKTFKDGDTLVFANQEFFINQNDIGDYNRGWSNVLTLWSESPWSYDADTVPTTDDISWDQSTYVPGYTEHLLDPAIPNRRIGAWRINISADRIVTLTSMITSDTFNGTGLKKDFQLNATSVSSASNLNVYVNHLLVNLDADYTITDGIISFITAPSIGVNNIVVTYNEIEYYNSLYVRNGFTYGGTNIYYDSLIKPQRLLPNYSIIPQIIRTEINSTRFDGNGTRFFDHRDSYQLPFSNDKYIKFASNNVFN